MTHINHHPNTGNHNVQDEHKVTRSINYRELSLSQLIQLGELFQPSNDSRFHYEKCQYNHNSHEYNLKLLTRTALYTDDGPKKLDCADYSAEIIRLYNQLHTEIDFNTVGQRIWPCSQLMNACLLHYSPEFKAKRILELGSGSGICGILLHQLFPTESQIILTDYNAILVLLANNMKQNAINPSNIDVMELNWKEESSRKSLLAKYPGGFDCIIAADCSYDSQLFQSLSQTIQTLINPANPHAFVIASHEIRSNINNLNEDINQSRVGDFEQIFLNNHWMKREVDTQELLRIAPIPADQTRKFALSWLYASKNNQVAE
jgi:predicted nicotinamide N-methyase